MNIKIPLHWLSHMARGAQLVNYEIRPQLGPVDRLFSMSQQICSCPAGGIIGPALRVEYMGKQSHVFSWWRSEIQS